VDERSRRRGRISRRPQPDADTPQHEPAAGHVVIDRERGVFNVDRQPGSCAAGREQRCHIPVIPAPAAGLHDRPPQPDGGDPGLAGRQVGERGAAGQMNLLDRQHRLAVGPVTDREAAHENPLPLDQAGRPDAHRECREPLPQPGLHSTADLLAEALGTERYGHDHCRDGERERPADERPQDVGDRLHGRSRPDRRRGRCPGLGGDLAVAPAGPAGAGR
jgi:hypothetical protein